MSHSSIKMIKLEDGDYVPEECCTFCRNFETGEMEIDDVSLPCGGDCSCGGQFEDSCKGCTIQEIMNEYGRQKENSWIPVDERLPETDDYILVSFSNYTLPDIGRYEADKDGGGTFYPGDNERSYVSYGLFVNAWMELPECYKEDEP